MMEAKRKRGRPKGTFKYGGEESQRIKVGLSLRRENVAWLREHLPMCEMLDSLVEEARKNEKDNLRSNSA